MSILETSRCLLRVIEPGDGPALFRNFSDPTVMAYYDMPAVANLAAMERMLQNWRRDIASGKRYRWAIVLKESGEVIGSCGMHGLAAGVRSAELGYELARDHWGKGIMSEILPALLDHAFRILRLDHLIARTRPANAASIALLRRFGFRIRLVSQTADWIRYRCV